MRAVSETRGARTRPASPPARPLLQHLKVGVVGPDLEVVGEVGLPFVGPRDVPRRVIADGEVEPLEEGRGVGHAVGLDRTGRGRRRPSPPRRGEALRRATGATRIPKYFNFGVWWAPPGKENRIVGWSPPYHNPWPCTPSTGGVLATTPCNFCSTWPSPPIASSSSPPSSFSSSISPPKSTKAAAYNRESSFHHHRRRHATDAHFNNSTAIAPASADLDRDCRHARCSTHCRQSRAHPHNE